MINKLTWWKNNISGVAASGVSDQVITAQLTRGIEPMLFYCWVDVEDGGPTLELHWLNVSCFLGEK